MPKRLIFLIAALIGCSVPAFSQRAKILGVVIDSFTQQPLEGATVSLGATRLWTSTSSQGTFSLERCDAPQSNPRGCVCRRPRQRQTPRT